jgi:hypothetical protein
LHRADLDVAGLTLEPIAAANAAIPPTMRALNLALVDVGAGTSDIAITRDGAVTGYAMVPRAGDALTEAIALAYLLDFPEAERVKVRFGDLAARALSPEPTDELVVEARDVLGQQMKLTRQDLQTTCQPVLDDLARKIAREILELNGKAPAAALCIGGGSQSPGLGQALAQALGLPANRVGVRGADLVRAVDLGRLAGRPEVSALLLGPAGVTPLGIAWGGLYRPGFRFRDAWVRVSGPLRPDEEAALAHLLDERRVQVLDLGRATLFDALVAAGIPARDLTGRPGLGMAVRVDGHLRLIPGSVGKSAEVRLDGQKAALDDKLPEGARIVARTGTPGEPARATLAEVVRAEPMALTVNGSPVTVTPVLQVGGDAAPADLPLRDGTEIVVCRDLAALLPQAGVGPFTRALLCYRINGIEQELPLLSWELSVNGAPAVPETLLQAGDDVRAVAVRHPAPRVADVVPAEPLETVRLQLNGDPIEIPVAGFRVLRNGIEVPGDTPVADGDDFRVEIGTLPIVADLLGLIQSELAQDAGPGKKLRLQVDGSPGQFTTPLRQGARIDARWVEIQPQSGLS